MRQPTLFAMYRHRVVAEIADRIGLVVADIEIALMPQQVEHDIREPRIAIVENADVDLARAALGSRGRRDPRSARSPSGPRAAARERAADRPARGGGRPLLTFAG